MTCAKLLSKWKDWISKPWVLLCCMSMCTFTQGMLVNSLIPQSITTIQKKFHLNTTQAGFFGNAYEVSALLFIIPCTYFGGKGNKIRWLSIGMFIVGLGASLCALPQFISKPYQAFSNKSDLCLTDITTELPSASESNTLYFLMLVTGNFLTGLGATPIYSLGITQLDECAPSGRAAIYIGVYLACSILGPAIGYLAGGFSLRIYGDFYREQATGETLDVLKHLDPSDAEWYGAWWIGFLVAAAMAFSASFLLFLFSYQYKKLKPAKKVQTIDKLDEMDVDNQLPEDGSSTSKISFAAFWADVKDILYRGSFMFLVAVDTLEGLIDTGVVLFFPKLLENFFRISASMSSVYTGASVIPSAVIGTILGSWLINKFKMGATEMTKMCILLHTLCFFILPMFLLRCSTPDVVGINHSYNTFENSTMSTTLPTVFNVTDTCNLNCHCDSYLWSPVCDVNASLSFVSPCFAGCTQEKHNLNDEEELFECSCTESDPNIGMTMGLCSDDCLKYIPFLALFALYVFLAFTSSIPIQKAELNSFPVHLKSLAFGVRWIFIRILGTIPSPIIFGYLIDNSCLYWTTDSEGDKLDCPLYNTDNLSLIFSLIGCIMKAFIVLCLFGSWRKFRKIGSLHIVGAEGQGDTHSKPHSPSPGPDAVWTKTNLD